MNSKKQNFSKVLGIIIGISSIVMMLVDFIYESIQFDTTMLIVILSISVILFIQKPKEKSEKINFTPKQKVITLSIVSVVLVAGIVVFITTLL